MALHTVASSVRTGQCQAPTTSMLAYPARSGAKIRHKQPHARFKTAGFDQVQKGHVLAAPQRPRQKVQPLLVEATSVPDTAYGSATLSMRPPYSPTWASFSQRESTRAIRSGTIRPRPYNTLSTIAPEQHAQYDRARTTRSVPIAPRGRRGKLQQGISKTDRPRP
eukprot:2947358-Rhodomonas_salina.4